MLWNVTKHVNVIKGNLDVTLRFYFVNVVATCQTGKSKKEDKSGISLIKYKVHEAPTTECTMTFVREKKRGGGLFYFGNRKGKDWENLNLWTLHKKENIRTGNIAAFSVTWKYEVWTRNDVIFELGLFELQSGGWGEAMDTSNKFVLC